MLKKFLPYLGEYKKYAVLTPLLMVLEVLCELALPRFMANMWEFRATTSPTF